MSTAVEVACPDVDCEDGQFRFEGYQWRCTSCGAFRFAEGVEAALVERIEELTKPKPRARRSGGIKRDSADIRFSKMIRERDGYTCQRCGKVYDPSSSGLHAMHMYSRRIKATRLDPENAASGCYGCHAYLDSHANEKIQFFRELLGDSRFDALSERAHAKRDRSQGR